MSNRVTLIRTTFKDITGESKGYRLYDDYAQTYFNTLDSIPG